MVSKHKKSAKEFTKKGENHGGKGECFDSVRFEQHFVPSTFQKDFQVCSCSNLKIKINKYKYRK